MTKPSIILIRPQMGENIGATARAMHNFGLSDLRIVNPRDGWPNEKARSMAANAKEIIENATLYNSTAEAIADCHQVIATTARHRGMNKPEMPISSLVSSSRGMQCRGDLHPPRGIAASEAEPLPRNDEHDLKTAIMFGPERTGLENEDITHADAVLHIPVSPDNPSLNLGQAVNIVCYEWFVQFEEFRVQSSEFSDVQRESDLDPQEKGNRQWGIGNGGSRGEDSSSNPSVGAAVSSIARNSSAARGETQKTAYPGGYLATSKDATSAPHGDLQALFDHLEGYLDEANFWNVPEKKPKMWQNIRTSLTRAQLTKQEVQTWHGVFRSVSKGK